MPGLVGTAFAGAVAAIAGGGIIGGDNWLVACAEDWSVMGVGDIAGAGGANGPGDGGRTAGVATSSSTGCGAIVSAAGSCPWANVDKRIQAVQTDKKEAVRKRVRRIVCLSIHSLTILA